MSHYTYKFLAILLSSFVPAVYSITEFGFPNFELHGWLLEQTTQNEFKDYKIMCSNNTITYKALLQSILKIPKRNIIVVYRELDGLSTVLQYQYFIISKYQVLHNVCNMNTLILYQNWKAHELIVWEEPPCTYVFSSFLSNHWLLI